MRRGDAPADEGPPYVGALLRQCLEHVRARIEADLRSAGFTDLQPFHLPVFNFPPPDGVRPSDLARRIRMSRQATNHIIGQLEALGYLERRSARKGERRLIYLTPRSWGMVKVVHATLLEIQAEWASDIGADRFDGFMTALRRFASRG
ncbi:MAG: MarR family transcriptional regulator [Hyphomicrobiales bacterium]|nr:MarR family transcriptional regulator [Hyphomicrobiales bacterium]